MRLLFSDFFAVLHKGEFSAVVEDRAGAVDLRCFAEHHAVFGRHNRLLFLRVVANVVSGLTLEGWHAYWDGRALNRLLNYVLAGG